LDKTAAYLILVLNKLKGKAKKQAIPGPDPATSQEGINVWGRAGPLVVIAVSSVGLLFGSLM
jgi:hypothetical protein